MNYYNEFDPFAAAWLRELISQRLIPRGLVDDRSITEVKAEDLAGFTQCHFFAGIGGWPLSLQLAGVSHKTPLWTGSPPCQPFSVAGKQLGQLDDRHLAPTFMRLVAQCRPPVLFGEQVAAAIGKHWLDDLFTELERQGYACGAAVLPAASVGAPHKRDRLFFGAAIQLADPNSNVHPRTLSSCDAASQGIQGIHREEFFSSRESCGTSEPIPYRLADTNDPRPQGWGGVSECANQQPSGASGMADSLEQSGGQRRERRETPASGHQHDRPASLGSKSEYGIGEPGAHRVSENSADTHHGFWSDADWLGCRDGKFRPVEPSTFPLANGIPARVGRLRGYGNAIVPQVAAEFITAFMGAAADAIKG